jgi:hypothetical protein
LDSPRLGLPASWTPSPWIPLVSNFCYLKILS